MTCINRKKHKQFGKCLIEPSSVSTLFFMGDRGSSEISGHLTGYPASLDFGHWVRQDCLVFHVLFRRRR